MEMFIFFTAVYCVRHQTSRNRKSQKYYVTHGGILLALTTIEVVVDTTWGRLMWIDHRNDPGGPLGFYSASVSTWYCILGVAACAMANILGDGLLVRSTSTARAEERAERLTQWLTVVSMLHNLGPEMVYPGTTGAYIPGFLWCECDP